MRNIVLESRGTFSAVSEQEIREARRLVEECEGLSLCFTAAAAVAGLARVARAGGISAGETIVVNLTGRDREPVPLRTVCWYKRTNTGWELEDGRSTLAQEWWKEAAR